MASAPRLPAWLLPGLVSVLLAACAAPAAPAAAPTARPAAPAAAGPSTGAAPTTAAAPAASQRPHTLQAGVQGLAGFFYPMWVAQEKGMLREQNLTVEWSTVGTNEAIPALLGGSLDLLLASTDSAVTALTKGGGLKVVADYNVITPYEIIAQSDITDVNGLRGKKVGASSLRAGSGTIARYMLKARGLEDADYELTQVGGNPQRYAALQSGGVQAAIITDPVTFRARLDGYRSLAAFVDIAPEYSLDSWWVRADWLQNADNADALVRYLVAQERAKQWAQNPANRDAMIALLEEQSHSPREVAEQIYDYYVRQYPGAIDSTDIRDGPVGNVIRIMRELEDLPPLPPESAWIDRTYAQRARELTRP